MTNMLALLLGILSASIFSAVVAAPLPPVVATSTGLGVILDGQEASTFWEADAQPLVVDPSASSVTIRRASLRRVPLLTPEPSAPLAFTSSFLGPWYLEDLLIYTSSCEELSQFAELACELQPTSWITSSGWSVTIRSFVPPPGASRTTTVTNVTLTCDTANSPTSIPPPTAACVTATASTSAELLALLASSSSSSPAVPPLPPTSRLHITLTANISLDVPSWTAAHPVLTRPNTTISGDCAPGRVTALDLAGGTSMVAVASGAVLRLLCLELTNLATDTLHNMPRGLLSGAIWAVNVDIPSGSKLWVDNSTLILTKDEFMWQSYYMAQVLANTAVGSSVTSVLRVFQGSMTTSNLQWHFVLSPHTRWRDCILTTVPSVFNTTVPNSFIMSYLGHSLYLTDLRMAYSCDALRTAVSNLTSVDVPSAQTTYAVVLGANISIGDCWPAAGVAVASQALVIMGLPDRPTVLNMSGRHDAFKLGIGATLSLRYLTLVGLGTHPLEADDDAGKAGGAAGEVVVPAISQAGSSTGALFDVRLMTSLLWAFHYSRLGLQMQLDNVVVVLPYAELKQYGKIVTGRSDFLPYFKPLTSYIQTSSFDSVAYLSSVAAAAAPANSASSSAVLPLPFHVLLLPGIRGLDVKLMSWPTQYGNWSDTVYDTIDSATGGGGGGGGGEDNTGGWASWRVAVLAVGVGLAAVAVMAAALVYGRQWRKAGDVSVGAGGGKSRRRGGDVESGFEPYAGGGGGGGAGGDGRGRPAAGALVAAGRGSANTSSRGMPELRRPLYDSFDDPAFELDLVKGSKLSPDDVADILDRINADAAEFNILMTEICGSGSFGVVYGGLWHGLKVAIKTMVISETAPPLIGALAARQQCIREAAFCCTMHHPNVVATYHYYLKSAKRATMLDELLQHLEPSPADIFKPIVPVARHRNNNITAQRNPPPATAAACGADAATDGGAGAEAAAALEATAATAAAAVAASAAEVAAIPMIAGANPSHKKLRREQGDAALDKGGEEGQRRGEQQQEGGEDGKADKEKGQQEKEKEQEGKEKALPERKRGGRGGFCRIPGPPPARKVPELTRPKAAVTDWRLYLIQEFCDGGTLRQAVDDRKIFRHSGAERGKAAAEAAEAAAAAAAAAATAAAAAEATARRDSLAAAAAAAAASAGSGDRGHGNSRSDPLPHFLLPELEALIAEANASTAAHSAAALALEAEAGGGGGGGGAAAAAAVTRVPSTAAQRWRAMVTNDSQFFGTNATNATENSAILGTTATDCDLNDPTVATPTAATDNTNFDKDATAASAIPSGPPPPSQPLMVVPMSLHTTPPQAVLPLTAVAAAATATAAAPAVPAVPADALPADLAVVVHTALGIASGVAYLHSRSIIHGDLSANNVLLVKTQVPGIPVVAKLSDFGLSMRLEQGQDHLKDVHHGTPYYQSPEVMEYGTCSLAADVYSLGVLLWELYHGPPPWRAKKHRVRKVKVNLNLFNNNNNNNNTGPDGAAPAAPEAATPEAAAAAKAAAPPKATADDDLWDDPYYKLRACDVLQIAPHCPSRYARLVRRCLSPDPRDRPSARSVVKALLSLERGMAAAAAAAGGGGSTVAGAPVGALMALTRPHLAIIPGRTHDAALLLEDFDAAAAAVAAAVARVTAAPTVAGAPASAGAAAKAAKAAKAGTASSGLLAVIGPPCATPPDSAASNAGSGGGGGGAAPSGSAIQGGSVVTAPTLSAGGTAPSATASSASATASAAVTAPSSGAVVPATPVAGTSGAAAAAAAAAAVVAPAAGGTAPLAAATGVPDAVSPGNAAATGVKAPVVEFMTLE